ncbi:MarR family transcriptional regulator [Nocardia sp. R7R-8]|uniref:MarR family transcriptional regulator n=1 Tax=Nocardia sp. R7R-8 TaxID=3459304 RepID=UPI00403D9D54
MTYLVKRLESAVRRDLDDALREHGLTTPQYAALSILGRHPGMSSAQLARRAFVTAQSMQVMVAAFARSGYVERRPRPDNQRILCNYLTDKGRGALVRCEEAAEAVEKKMLDGLDRPSVAALRTALELCVRNLADG